MTNKISCTTKCNCSTPTLEGSKFYRSKCLVPTVAWIVMMKGRCGDRNDFVLYHGVGEGEEGTFIS